MGAALGLPEFAILTAKASGLPVLVPLVSRPLKGGIERHYMVMSKPPWWGQLGPVEHCRELRAWL
jgi:hypothetical protein